MEYKNLDKAEAYSALLKDEKKDIKTLLTAERVKKSEVKLGGGLKYNWAAMPVDGKIIKDYQKLADEMELIEKYLLGGKNEYHYVKFQDFDEGEGVRRYSSHYKKYKKY